MGQIIGVVGAECTGKSSLAAALRSELGGVYVPESLREWVIAHGRTPRAEEQLAILRAQQQAEEVAVLAARQTASEWVIADPAPLMTAVYSVAYFQDRSLLAEGLQLLSSNRLTVWCQPDFEWQADGIQRDGPAVRAQVDDILAEVLADQPYEVIKVFGTVEQRVAAVLHALADR